MLTLVVPCFNEAQRLRPAELDAIAAACNLVLVDDGSTDETARILDQLAGRHPTAVIALHLAKNSGKGEAVRAGLSHAIEQGADWVGFFDADLSTPVDEILRLARIALDQPAHVRVILGSRVKLLGKDIQRSAVRHYLGRVFATGASLVLDLPVYDTQCGAKIFRVDDVLQGALARPFTTRWIFDVELLQRLCETLLARGEAPEHAMVEVPLQKWTNVRGSKLGIPAMAQAAWHLVRLRLARRPR